MENQEINMIKIQISNSEQQIINKYFKEYVIEQNILEFSGKEDVEKLLDKLSSLLCENGLNIDDIPNELGNNIESLIDKVNSKLY
jgi:hypothetical protein